MRGIALCIATAALSACTYDTAPAPMAVRTAVSQHQIDLLLAGRVPQRPISCLPSMTASGSNDMQIIDPNTLTFRYGSTLYVAHTTGCTNLTPNGMYALLTRSYGGTGLCRGDVAQVVQPGSAIPVGSCLITDITPFVPRPR